MVEAIREQKWMLESSCASGVELVEGLLLSKVGNARLHPREQESAHEAPLSQVKKMEY